MQVDNQLPDIELLLGEIQTLRQQLDHTRAELQLVRSLMDSELTGIDLQSLVTLVHNSPHMISLADLNGNMLYLNPAGKSLVGLPADAALPTLISDFIYPDDIEQLSLILSTLVEQGTLNGEVRMRNFQVPAEPILVAFAAFCVHHPQTNEVIGLGSINRDIRQQRQTEEDIKLALREKDMLMQELHHRVTNNFQFVSSLLNFRIRQTGDGAVVEALQESRQQIRAIAMIHQMLYQADGVKLVRFDTYFAHLNRLWSEVYRAKATITYQVAPDISLDLSQAVPCALIINELVNNAVKYAFADDVLGVIHIDIQLSEYDYVKIRVQDNGQGLPEGYYTQGKGSLGLYLVNELVLQLQGDLEYQLEAGSLFKIQFPRVVRGETAV
ncbi:PAS domain S-box protein [filamentous cyanobacterium LEGE 11480]|uniref:histidine kinase n=1 Tax=Romeriopsis navalis LEGE 11480 TaxID=2777977 RepID=A0A928VNP1_9CYAN|nr:histidine kinase dimerization/phosphoacceptor domain -containing protein [Romeriopsis navalis]MBE9030056.1 PAS domain S-box protein [Romeriopsis navalis LEGE 11480]